MTRERSDKEWKALEERTLTIPHITRQEHQALQRCSRYVREAQTDATLAFLVGLGMAITIIFLPLLILSLPFDRAANPGVVIIAVLLGTGCGGFIYGYALRGRRQYRDVRLMGLREDPDYARAIQKLNDMLSATQWLTEYDELVRTLSDPPAVIQRRHGLLVPKKPERVQQVQ